MLLSLADLKDETIPELLEHARSVASVIPIMGFYLQPAVGGRLLSYEFWRQFVEIENVVAIKIAPFNRYQTLDVVRALAQSGRAQEVALYTGNDDNILNDLLTQFDFGSNREFELSAACWGIGRCGRRLRFLTWRLPNVIPMRFQANC